MVTSVNDLHDGDVIVIANSEYNKAMGMQRTSNRGSVLISFTDKSNETFNCVANVAELTLKKTSDDKWQFLIDGHFLYAAGTGQQNYLKQTDNKAEKTSVATIVFDVKNATIKFESNNRNTIRYNSSKGLFSCYAFNSQEAVQIYKKQNSNLTPTNTTFGEGVDNNTFEVKDGEIVETRVATVTPGEATGSGSIVYESSDEAIAKVDAKTGAITLGAKYGTAVITAKFVAKGSFANSEASYSIKHVGDFVFYESFDNFTETQGGNDGNFAQGGGTVKSELLDEEGWILKSQYAANKCIRLGAKSTEGSATTRTINVPTSKATLSFKAAAWNNTDDMTTITVSVSDGSLTYDNKTNKSMTINMRKDAWTDYSMIVSGTKSFTVTFAGSDTKNRFFLDEVMVTKVAPQEITLDENSDNIVEAAENVNVTLKRTFYKDGEWNTLCLPFAVADAKTAFDNAELREVDTQNSHDNTIVFKEATAIEAGKPYLIKWANSSSAAVNVEKKFEGVTLVAAATPVVVKEGGISFNGFYKMTAASELGGASVAAIGAGNKLFKVTEGKMKGFRAAFVLSSGAEATKYNVVIDGTATGIEDLVIDDVKANGRVYNLNGQYVGNSLNGLQPGLYIQNGKKIVVK